MLKTITTTRGSSQLMSFAARNMSTKHYDVVVIGSGQGGTPLASAFAQAKFKTALIESTHVQGCCVNEGCTPTKTMISSGRVAYLARRGKDYGVVTGAAGGGGVQVEMEKVRQRKRDIVNTFRGGSERRIRDQENLDLVMGRASFQDGKTLKVALNDGSDAKEMTIIADRMFINVGERPALPQIGSSSGPGVDKSAFPPDTILDSTTVQELGRVPNHLIVIGGGYIGLEFGQLFRRLGAEVTILQRGGQLMPREDTEVAEAMLKILQEDGIKVLLDTSPTQIRPTGGADAAAAVTIEVKSKAAGSGSSQTSSLQGSHVLFAAGRTPNTDTLNLEAAGIKTASRGHIVVDAQLRTSNPSIWALGDVKGGPAFTHVSYDDFRILRTNLLDSADPTKKDSASKTLTTTDRLLPYVCYTDPQMAHVGLHVAEARVKFPDRKIQSANMPMAYVARALETDESRGLMKAVVDADSQQILGFTCLGLEGGELMAVVQMAMVGGVKWPQLRDAVFAHPSLAESLNNLWGFLE